MDPKLFDIVWEVYRESGSSQPIDVLSGYRSPHTNAMLRRRSRQVAEHSQHMEGKAIDAHFVDVGTATIRDVAMRMQAGGVGFYPTGATPWVHIDSGSVRYWPRMSRDALARLFPGRQDGVHSRRRPADAGLRAGARRDRTARRRGADRPRERRRISACCRGCSERAAAAPTTRRRAAAAKPSRRAEAAAGRAARAPRSRARPRTRWPRPSATCRMARLSCNRPNPRPSAASRRFARFERAERRGPDQPAWPDRGAIHRPRAAAQARRSRREPARRGGCADAAAAPRRIRVRAAPPAKATGEDGAANRDLIAALLERGRLPGVITRGVGAAPSDALALAETTPPEPPERPAMLARAAALAAPLPPIAADAGARAARPSRRRSTARPLSRARPRRRQDGRGRQPARRSRDARPGLAFGERCSAQAANPYGELSSNDARASRPTPTAIWSTTPSRSRPKRAPRRASRTCEARRNEATAPLLPCERRCRPKADG